MFLTLVQPICNTYLNYLYHTNNEYLKHTLKPSITHIRYVSFFKCCEQVYAYNQEKSYTKRLRNYTRNPEKYPAPKRFKRKGTTWPKHLGPMSSTDDTDNDTDTGGVGRYSHSDICLSHQHFARQLVAAGSFGVHCTQGPEACHKLVMRTASVRVRHLRPNTTKDHMLKYLFYNQLFEELRNLRRTETSTRPINNSPTVRAPLMDPITKEPVTLGQELHTPDAQGQFLHPEARITRSELLDLVCGKLTLAKTIATYQVIHTIITSFTRL